jgi:hypothetical protein
MRRATTTFLAVAAGGAVLLVALGLARGSSLVYTLGVQPQLPVVALAPGAEACQAPVHVPPRATFGRIAFNAAAAAEPTRDLEVSVWDHAHTSREAQAAVAPAAKPADGTAPPAVRADIGDVRPDEPLQVCFANRGREPIELWGGPDAASGLSTAAVDGTTPGVDLTVVLEDSEQRSALALLPDMAERASRFRARWLSPVAYLVLALLVVIGVPALLAGAVATARD